VPSRVLTKEFQRTQGRTRRAILSATFLILSVGATSAWQMLRLSSGADLVVRSYDAVQAIGELTEALLSAETGQRGFLLTGQSTYLADYSAAVRSLPLLRDQLLERVAPYVDDEHRRDLSATLDVKLAEMAEVLELHQDGHHAEARRALETNSGKLVMDNLREMLDLVRRAEEARLVERQAEFRRTRSLGIISIAAVGLLSCVIAFLLLRGQHQATKRLLAAVNIIQRQKGYLEAMLSSVSAPLILLDLEGNIRFANSASVQLFDAPEERLIGRPLTEYVQFRGSSERSGDESIFERAVAERRVLRERRVGIQTPSGPQVIGLTVRPVEAEGGAPIGCMITLRDIDEEEAAVEELHQQDRVRNLEATLGRIVAETAGARQLLGRCADAVRQMSDGSLVRIWIGDVLEPGATLSLGATTAKESSGEVRPSSLVESAWRDGMPTSQRGQKGPYCAAFPMVADAAALGVLEIVSDARIHERLASELPRLANAIALGYERRRTAETVANIALEKDRFIATLSHELRGPLLPLKFAVSEISQRGTQVDPKLTGLMSRQVIQLERLVEDLLDAQRLKRGTLSLRLARFDLRQAIEQSAEAVEPLLEGRRQRVEIELPSEALPIEGDQARLVQVISNLLNNASRYSPRESVITVRAERDGENALVRVIDRGIGIAEENLARVFHMFDQGSTGGNSDGLGIGLALVRQLLELHGGTVSAASPGVGQGATFTVQLPLREVHDALPLAPQRSELVRDERAREHEPPTGIQLEAPRPGKSSPVHPPVGMFDRCVVVDDDVDSAETIALMLKSWGLSASVAHDASGALEAIGRLEPELVLLDLTMPGQDRYAIIERLRGEKGSRLRVVAVTGHADEEVRKEALARGFDDLLVKPISAEQLAAAASRSSSLLS